MVYYVETPVNDDGGEDNLSGDVIECSDEDGASSDDIIDIRVSIEW